MAAEPGTETIDLDALYPSKLQHTPSLSISSILSNTSFTRDKFFATLLTAKGREHLLVQEDIVASDIPADEIVLVCNTTHSLQKPSIKRTVCIPMGMLCRSKHNQALKKHIETVSCKRLRLDAPLGDWTCTPRVVTRQFIPMGMCMIEEEECMETCPVVLEHSQRTKRAGPTEKLNSGWESAQSVNLVLGSLASVLCKHHCPEKPFTEINLKTLSPLLQDLMTPTNVLVGFRSMHPSLRVMCMSILSKNMFLILCVIVALRCNMPGVLHYKKAVQNIKKVVKKARSTKDKSKKLKESQRTLFKVCNNKIEFTATFPSTHAFRTACCHLKDWKVTSEVNAIPLNYMKDNNQPTRAIVALRDIPIGAEVVLPNEPRFSLLETKEDSRLKECACKVCTNTNDAKEMTQAEEHATWVMFHAMALWFFSMGSKVGRGLYASRTQGLDPSIVPSPSTWKADESFMRFVKDPNTFIVWNAISKIFTSTNLVSWTNEMQERVAGEIVFYVSPSQRMSFWVIIEGCEDGFTYLNVQCCQEDALNPKKVLDIFKRNLYHVRAEPIRYMSVFGRSSSKLLLPLLV